MNLWIRSQDGLYLMKVETLTSTLRANKEPAIVNTINDVRYLLGEYKTKERAFEVLDEIQILLQGNTFIGTINRETECIVYEMPKE